MDVGEVRVSPTCVWRLYDAVMKDEGRAVTVIVQLDPANFAAAKELAQRIKILRHPYIVRYRNFATDDTCVAIAVDPVIPLRRELPHIVSVSEVVYGVASVHTTLGWLQKDAKLPNVGVIVDTVFVGIIQGGRPWLCLPDGAGCVSQFAKDALQLSTKLEAPLEAPPVLESLTLLEAIHGFAAETGDHDRTPLTLCRWYQQDPFINLLDGLLKIPTHDEAQNEAMFAEVMPLLTLVSPGLVQRRVLPLVLNGKLLSKTFAEPMFTHIFQTPEHAEQTMHFMLDCLKMREIEIRMSVLRYLDKLVPYIGSELLASMVIDELTLGTLETDDSLAVLHMKGLVLACRELLRRSPPMFSDIGIAIEDPMCRRVNVAVVTPLYHLAGDKQWTDDFRCNVLASLLRMWDIHPKLVKGMILSALHLMLYEDSNEIKEKAMVTLQIYLHHPVYAKAMQINELTFLILPLITPLCVDTSCDIRTRSAELAVYVLNVIKEYTTNNAIPVGLQRLQPSTFFVSPRLEKPLVRKAVFKRKGGNSP